MQLPVGHGSKEDATSAGTGGAALTAAAAADGETAALALDHLMRDSELLDLLDWLPPGLDRPLSDSRTKDLQVGSPLLHKVRLLHCSCIASYVTSY